MSEHRTYIALGVIGLFFFGVLLFLLSSSTEEIPEPVVVEEVPVVVEEVPVSTEAVIGQSVEGRDINAVSFGTGDTPSFVCWWYTWRIRME